jgi:hypothetical protein
VELLSQARLAARSCVSLDTVLRRYCAGNALFVDALIEEAEPAGLSSAEVQHLLRSQASGFDRLLAAVSDEYTREEKLPRPGSKQHRLELLRRLLAGELLDVSDLRYDLEAHHLGVIATGPRASAALGALGERIDRQLLLAEPGEQTAWAWLGGRREFDPHEFDFLASFTWPEETAVAFGEPAEGLPGWRLTHRQATVALPIAERSGGTHVHHADVALLASALHDDILASSLRHCYLAPLEADRDGGSAAKQTLRAVFCAGGNISSAAAALGVNRATVRSRIAAVEERLGRPLDIVSAELQIALRLDELEPV